MDVIGHDYVPSNGYVSLLRPLTEYTERVVNFRSGKKSESVMSIERNEVKRPDILKKKFKPGRPSHVCLSSLLHLTMLRATRRQFNLESL
jgi:hypothetical protein